MARDGIAVNDRQLGTLSQELRAHSQVLHAYSPRYYRCAQYPRLPSFLILTRHYGLGLFFLPHTVWSLHHCSVLTILACARIRSQEGQDYLKAMSAAANYAWVNRSMMTFLTRQAFSKAFKQTPDDLDMQGTQCAYTKTTVLTNCVMCPCSPIVFHARPTHRRGPPCSSHF